MRLVTWVVLLTACTTAPDPVDRILVTGEDGSITTYSADGDEPRILREPTPEGTTTLQPTWAPGGRSVIWTESTAAGAEIVVSDQEETWRVDAPLAPFFYGWSQNGRTVAFLGNSPSGTGVSLGLLDVEKRELRLVDQGRPYYLDWGPDDLLVHVDGANVARLAVDGSKSPLAVTTGIYQAPDLTPDGRFVAVRATSGGVAGLRGLAASAQTLGQELAVFDGDGGNPQGLTPLEGLAYFSVNSVGDRIAFTDTVAVPRLSFGPLAVAGFDGTVTPVTADPVTAFDWSPDGSLLLYWAYDAEALQMVPQVWDGETDTSFPAFDPTTHTLQNYLPFWDQYTRVLTTWSPDSTAFTYASDLESGKDMVYVQRLTDPEPVAIGNGVFASWSPGDDQ